MTLFSQIYTLLLTSKQVTRKFKTVKKKNMTLRDNNPHMGKP